MYTAAPSDALFPMRFFYHWQEDQQCLQSLCQHTPSIALISVTQHTGCSTTQPAGYWTCEAFPFSEDLSHKQSLKTAWDWLALGVIDCWNQSHKNDCIGSWVGEPINYRACQLISVYPPLWLHLSFPSLTKEYVIVVLLICFTVETYLPLICIRACSPEKAYLSL